MVSKSTLINFFTLYKVISLKDNNQRSITLIHNSVYYAYTKYIDIQYHYICDKVAVRQINLQYILTIRMIVDRLTKASTYGKFHIFIK